MDIHKNVDKKQLKSRLASGLIYLRYRRCDFVTPYGGEIFPYVHDLTLNSFHATKKESSSLRGCYDRHDGYDTEHDQIIAIVYDYVPVKVNIADHACHGSDERQIDEQPDREQYLADGEAAVVFRKMTVKRPLAF